MVYEKERCRGELPLLFADTLTMYMMSKVKLFLFSMRNIII